MIDRKTGMTAGETTMNQEETETEIETIKSFHLVNHLELDLAFFVWCVEGFSFAKLLWMMSARSKSCFERTNFVIPKLSFM